MNTSKLKTVKTATLLATAILSFSSITSAASDSKYNWSEERRDNAKHQNFVYGKVIKAKPVYDIITTKSPLKQCWQEPVTSNYRINQRGHNNSAGTLAGGLIGGIIGHQFGKGRGKRVATAVGTLVGAQLGHDNSDNGYAYSDHTSVTYRDVCEVTHEESYKKVLDGYQVTYRYKGNKYEARMPYDPGDRVKLKVSINPVF